MPIAIVLVLLLALLAGGGFVVFRFMQGVARVKKAQVVVADRRGKTRAWCARSIPRSPTSSC